MLHSNNTAQCFIEPELLPIKVLHCGNNLFGSCGLDLDPMTFIYEFDPKIVEIHRVCKNMNLLRQGFRKLRLTDTHTGRQTDRHTYREDQNYYTRRFADGSKYRLCNSK